MKVLCLSTRSLCLASGDGRMVREREKSPPVPGQLETDFDVDHLLYPPSLQGKEKRKKRKKFNGNRSPIVQPVPQTHALVTKKCRCGYHRSKRLKCKAMLSCLRQNEDGTQSVQGCPPEYHSFREGFCFIRWEVFRSYCRRIDGNM